jgi:hypothetical protein
MREIGEKKYADGAILRKILEQLKPSGNGALKSFGRKNSAVFGKKKQKNRKNKQKRKIK